MAKMKVHELAKALDRQSKELIAFLQDKGFDVKVAQSSIEDEAITLVKKHFVGPGAEKAAAPAEKAAAPAEKAASSSQKEKVASGNQKATVKQEETVAGVKKIPAEGTAAPGEKAAAPEEKTAAGTEKAAAPAERARAQETPKKKKKIIFVSNPHNSKIGGSRSSQTNDRRASGNFSGSSARQGTPMRSGKEAPYRPIRPLTPPSPTPPVNMVPSSPVARKDAVKPALSEGKRLISEGKRLISEGKNLVPEGKNLVSEGKNLISEGKNLIPEGKRPISEGKHLVSERKRPVMDGRRPAPEGAPQNAEKRTAASEGRPASGQTQASSQMREARPAGARPSYDNGNGQRYQGGSGQRYAGSGNAPRYQNGANQRPGSGAGRTDNRYENRSGSDNRGGARPGTQNRPPYGGGQGDRRGPGSGPNNNRPYGNNDRGNRSVGGTDSRFRKPAPGKGFVSESPVKDTEKRRDDEKRRIGQERDKRSRKDLIYEDDKKTPVKKAGRFIKPEKREEPVEEQIKVITVPESLTIKELADKMRLQPSAIIKKLFLKGQIVTVNSEISYEEAENIAIDYDIICEPEVKVDVIEELLKEDEDKEENMTARPPVICVMGHVDHGKTSLLDAIRKTNVTDKEAGGITQHIGAYTVHVNGQKITFLDTPGHEAFTAMRMRGANSTDIAILVVAADDGVMPQTVEAINHAKAAGIEIIVAVNKVDKPNANIDRVKQEMTEYELIPVDWGGTTEFVPVSAKSGEGIDTLLETILLTAEILELKANTKRQARGLVIEAELDKGRGPVATVLVQKGTLHVGDFISAGACHGKVRAMIDDKGRRVKEALPSTPVEILGLSDVPSAGEVFIAHENDKTAKNYAETYLAQNKEKMLEDTRARMSLDDLFTQIKAGNLKELNLIVKADVQGSVEAVKQSLLKLSNEEVVVKCIHGGVGAINESDVSLASASQAIIIGFNVRPDAMAKTIAEREGVDIRLYKVIYQAIEDVEAAMKGMLDPVFEEKVTGHAEVRQIFKASAVGNIAGSYVLDGIFQRDCKVRITREGTQIYEGTLASLKRFKDDVKEVKAGFECGLVFEGFDQMQELDIVEAYIMVEVPR